MSGTMIIDGVEMPVLECTVKTQVIKEPDHIPVVNISRPGSEPTKEPSEKEKENDRRKRELERAGRPPTLDTIIHIYFPTFQWDGEVITCGDNAPTVAAVLAGQIKSDLLLLPNGEFGGGRVTKYSQEIQSLIAPLLSQRPGSASGRADYETRRILAKIRVELEKQSENGEATQQQLKDVRESIEAMRRRSAGTRRGKRKARTALPRWGTVERRMYDHQIHELIMVDKSDREVARVVVTWAKGNKNLNRFRIPSESALQKWAAVERAKTCGKRKKRHR